MVEHGTAQFAPAVHLVQHQNVLVWRSRVSGASGYVRNFLVLEP